MIKLNLGCGNHYHPAFVNLDFFSTSEHVTVHNLLNGIPFPDNYADVIYHSHVLEHFTKKDAQSFMYECYRVLKPNGILRVVVPDLEQIINEYTNNLRESIRGDKIAKMNYEWIMLELFDQMIRTESGGEILKYLALESIDNQDYIYKRWGNEAKKIRDNRKEEPTEISSISVNEQTNISICNQIRKKIILFIKHKIFKTEYQIIQNKLAELQQFDQYVHQGKFRMSGEIHQWMYDRYSLKLLLENCGFNNIIQRTDKDSYFPNWKDYQLDTIENGEIRKPDSLFIEAIK